MFNRILVALDGSACSHDAFVLALDLAQAHSSELALCSVAQRPELEAARSIVEAALQVATARGVACGGEALEAVSPASAICKQAKNIEADCIVLGTHGRSGFAKTVYGSVARDVLETAPCAVLTFRRARQSPNVDSTGSKRS